MKPGERPRQDRVVELLLQGCSNKDIAREMGLAIRTVKSHMNKLFLEHGLARSKNHKRIELVVKLYREMESRRNKNE